LDQAKADRIELGVAPEGATWCQSAQGRPANPFAWPDEFFRLEASGS
jgi:hypothetical protein